MQQLKNCATISLLTILVMDAAAAPSSTPPPSAGLLPVRRITNHTVSNTEFDEFWGHPDDSNLMNRGGFEGQHFADDGDGLMEHNALTDNGDVKTLEVIGSENADSLWRLGNSDDGTDTVFFNNEDDFAPDSETANDEFLEPRMLLSPGEEINEDLKGPGYDWSVMGKVKKVTTQKPQEINIHFADEEESDTKPWETDSRPRPNS